MKVTSPVLSKKTRNLFASSSTTCTGKPSGAHTSRSSKTVCEENVPVSGAAADADAGTTATAATAGGAMTRVQTLRARANRNPDNAITHITYVAVPGTAGRPHGVPPRSSAHNSPALTARNLCLERDSAPKPPVNGAQARAATSLLDPCFGRTGRRRLTTTPVGARVQSGQRGRAAPARPRRGQRQRFLPGIGDRLTVSGRRLRDETLTLARVRLSCGCCPVRYGRPGCGCPVRRRRRRIERIDRPGTLNLPVPAEFNPSCSGSGTT